MRVLVRLAGLMLVVVGLGFLLLGSSANGTNGGHDLSGGYWIGAATLFCGIGILFLRKWAVLLFLVACVGVGGKDLLDAYHRAGTVTTSHLLSVVLLCLPSLLLLCSWKQLK